MCASEDINSLYSRIFLVPVTQCSMSSYSQCNHINHNIVREVAHSVNQASEPLYYIMARSGELYIIQSVCTNRVFCGLIVIYNVIVKASVHAEHIWKILKQ